MRIQTIFITLFALFLILLPQNIAHTAEGEQVNILASTFPMYMLTRNIIEGADNISVDLLIPAELGCPHDYALSPQDMKKLSIADILIVNGLGLEEFLGAPLQRVNSKITVIDTSKGIDNTLHFTEDEEEEEHHNDEHTGVNPHLFASPAMNIVLANNISKELSLKYPNHKNTFQTNAKKYSESMQSIITQLGGLGKNLRNNRIIQPHGIFDYLAREGGIEIISTLQPHGEDPAAARMIELIKIIKKNNVGAIITEPQYPSKVGNTLAQETGIPIVLIDPVASGAKDSPLNIYATTMQDNIDSLKSALGTKE